MLLREIQELKKRCSLEMFENILIATEDDIRFNRLNFNKKTPPKKFLEILSRTEIVFRRIYEG